MIGDKLVITDYHRAAAQQVLPAVQALLTAGAANVTVSISGESGCGKTELAACLAESLERDGRRSLILGQDDYFRLPPKTNHEKRKQVIAWVGPGEVRLDLMNEHVAALRGPSGEAVTKPLVDFDNDRIGDESVCARGVEVIICEGTYTSLVEGIDLRVFIDRTYHQTRKNRLHRNRDSDPGFLERVLKIEHQVISKHRELADVVIEAPESERSVVEAP